VYNIAVADRVSINNSKHEYNINLINEPKVGNYDAIIITVSHKQFKELVSKGLHALGKENYVLYNSIFITIIFFLSA